MTSRCDGCGQPCLVDDAWTVRGLCSFCRERGPSSDEFEAARLFEPTPQPMPGQCDLFDPDEGEQ